MRNPATLVAFPLLCLLGAACGEPFTYVPGSGGAAGGAGTGGTDSGSSTSGTPKTCSPQGPDPCGGGFRCQTTTCATGVCVPKPTTAEGPKWDPVCGCDGVIYWNADIPLAAGVTYQDGVCNPNSKPSGIKTCTAATADTCGAGNHCYLHAPTIACGANKGVCMKLPPCIGTDKTVLPCGQTTCTSLCQVIESGNMWYTPITKACDPP